MPKKGLSKEYITEVATELLEEKGYDKFSLREIAARLGVKPASLYNHISGLDEINMNIAIRASEIAGGMLKKAAEGKNPDDAFIDCAIAYRQFALENPELYKAYIRKPKLKNSEVMNAGFESFAPIRDIVLSYGLKKEDTLNFIRGLRAVMCGFIELSNNGYMQKGNVSKDTSYEVIIRTYLKVLKEMKA